MVYFQIFPVSSPWCSQSYSHHSLLNKGVLQDWAVLGHCEDPVHWESAKMSSNFRFTSFSVIWDKFIQLSGPVFPFTKPQSETQWPLKSSQWFVFFKGKDMSSWKCIQVLSDIRRMKRWRRRKREEKPSRKWMNFPLCKHSVAGAP